MASSPSETAIRRWALGDRCTETLPLLMSRMLTNDWTALVVPL